MMKHRRVTRHELAGRLACYGSIEAYRAYRAKLLALKKERDKDVQ
jgi:hypothetical protein